MGGLNWQSIHDRYLRKIQVTTSAEEARRLMSQMIDQLPSSHLAIIPAWAYAPSRGSASLKQDSGSGDQSNHAAEDGSTGLTVTSIDGLIVAESVEKGSTAMQSGVQPGWIIESIDGKPLKDLFSSIAAARPEARSSLMVEIVQSILSGPVGLPVHISFNPGDGSHLSRDIPRQAPAGKLVQFGNLPPEHVIIEHRTLTNGVGYIRLNLFLDPVTVMPEFEKAINEFKDVPAIVLDLRNNPGGLGIMAMGLAGWFVSQDGLRLGTMMGRDLHTDFEINPRIEPYAGRLAILVNGGSASTTEILAQGLQDLGRARIFGTPTAGAALPSEIIELPNGDRFQYPEANYVSVKGRVLEGNGVQPDVVVTPTRAALLAGRDMPLEAAVAWGKEK